ncbi:CI135-like protein [Mya arenaria]|uniref:CI135-like protein n=1 Tax=Mya arenaria TaxID=6604 RepID=A0ABY7FW68_MYAAR|nr:CI135-like protein [Mya arenaria]
MAATSVTGVPDYYERQGSLFLRSDHMNYGRATLNSNWQGKQNQKIMISNLPSTTYQEFANQTNLKKDFAEQEVRKPMIGAPKHGFGSVLPRHNPDYNKHYLDTTHRSDFKPPNPNYVPVPECPPDFEDKSAAYRKCLSQFTDTANHRRPGRNTWQDESGIYTNTHYKQEVFKPTETIPPQLS